MELKGVGSVQNALEVCGESPIQAFLAGTLASRGSERYPDGVSDHFTLLFVREGMLPIQEEEQAFEVAAGQSLLLFPGRRRCGPADFSPDLCSYWLHFTVRKVSLKRSPPSVDQILSVPQHTVVSRPDYLECLFRRYLNDQESGRLLPYRAGLLAWILLCEIAEQRPVQDTDRTAAVLAGRALAYIRSHLHLPLTGSKIAHELGYNPEYLSRVFHQTYHRSLTEEIHQSRIAHARYLLLHRDMNANEIARACGFKDIGYFFRLFRRYEGVSPMAFRRLNAQLIIDSK